MFNLEGWIFSRPFYKRLGKIVENVSNRYKTGENFHKLPFIQRYCIGYFRGDTLEFKLLNLAPSRPIAL